MDVRQAMTERRTVHRYRTDPIPDGAVERALEAAILAPNHRLTYPWRFVRVGRETRAKLADLAVRLKLKPTPLVDEAIQKIRGKILDPAEMIAVSIVRCDNPEIAREDYASAACAIQNLTLSLYADGVSSKWSSGKVTTHEETYAILGIDSKTEEIVGFIWAGIAAKVPEPPSRPPLGELVRRLP